MEIHLQHRATSVAAALALTSLLTACGGQTIGEQQTKIEMNERSGPSTGASVIGVLPPYTVVQLDGNVSGNWSEVRTEEFGTGWVDRYYYPVN
jgi:uncharacterized protein YraI